MSASATARHASVIAMFRDSRASLTVLAAAVLWGTAGTAQALGHGQASPAALGAARLLVGGSTLAAVAALSPVGRAAMRSCFCRRSLPWTLAAAIATALYQVAFFSSVARTGVALGTIIMLGTAPLFTALLSRLFLREGLTRRWLLGTAVAVTGCALVIIPQGEISVNLLGFGLALVAAACYGVYTVSAKRLLHHHAPLAVIAASLGLGAVLLFPIALRQAPELLQPRSALTVLWLGFAATALAYTFFARGLRRVPAASVATLGLAEPLAAVLLGLLVLGERLSPIVSVGVMFLFAGLVLVATIRRVPPIAPNAGTS